jgi:phenylpropionate dioxygenase-like ring-hydroxylating dioxygenase large terminal subunit
MYHGWTFNVEGCPSGIARRADLTSDDVSEADLCLAQYQVEICGKFVFAKLDQSRGRHCATSSAAIYDDLEEISAHIGNEVLYETLSHKANWKLLAENVLDEEHCGIAHRQSFVPQGYCTQPVQRHRFEGPHSSGTTSGPACRGRAPERSSCASQSRGYVHDSYFHISIFPNSTSLDGGDRFYVGQTLPISAEVTLLRVRYFEPNVELSPKHRVRQDQLNADTNANGLRILARTATSSRIFRRA